jgi:hypothetical protein
MSTTYTRARLRQRLGRSLADTPRAAGDGGHLPRKIEDGPAHVGHSSWWAER